jgi:hypothetical protein
MCGEKQHLLPLKESKIFTMVKLQFIEGKKNKYKKGVDNNI